VIGPCICIAAGAAGVSIDGMSSSILPQDVMCMMIYVMYAMIMFCNISRLVCL
jgi:hypothetical protein